MPAKALRTGVALAAAVVSAVVALPAAAHAAPTAPPAATTVTTATTATTVTTVTTAKGDDFNGDGYADVAFSAPTATVGAAAKAGYVAVMYGSATGLKTASRQVFSQNTAGVPGAAEEGDAFGAAITTEDLDRDGYADLIVGATGENIAAVEDAGILSVIWGGANGLAGGAVLAEGKTLRERVGNLVKSGDFDADGNPDVVSIAESSDIRLLSGPFGRDGAARAASESPDPDGDTRFLDTSVGDVNGDGTDDLVAVVNSGEEWDSRSVRYWRSTPQGFAPAASVVGTNGYGIEGGEHIAAGDVNKDGYADLVVGRAVDGYDSDVDLPMAKGGMVTYVPGSATGPQGTKAKVFNQDTPGVSGAAETDDFFGLATKLVDTNRDNHAELLVGAPRENAGEGSVWLLPGTATGITTTGSFNFGAGTLGTTAPGAALGSAFNR